MQQLMADRETKMSTFSTESIQMANLPESLDWRKGSLQQIFENKKKHI
jgi:hypothetical protein